MNSNECDGLSICYEMSTMRLNVIHVEYVSGAFEKLARRRENL